MNLLKPTEFSLTAIVPYFNEEITLNRSVENLSKIKILDEIILVDDNSTDHSNNYGRILASSNNKIQYLRTPINLGKGGAVMHGLKNVSTTHIIIHDADLEYDPNDIYKMFDKLSNSNSLILGSRYLKNKNLNSKNMNYLLDKIEKVSTFFFNKIFKTKLTDIGSCYKLMPSQFLKQNKFFEKGFYMELEFLSKFVNQGGDVIEVPIDYFGRKKSDGKKNNIFIMIKFFITIFKISLKENRLFSR